MRHIVNRNKYNFVFSKSITPVLEVKNGDEITFYTKDALNGTVPHGEDVVLPDIDLKKANPITGPIYIKDAKPGDVLLVKIKEIKVNSLGYVVSNKSMGVVKGLVSKNLARNMKIENGLIHFSKNIKIPISPMIGTIGVAPLEGEIFSVYVGVHGGNMDNNDIKVGSIIYFPVFVKGALLSVGDVHASMGDGELTSGGVDTCAEVILEVGLIKDKKINRPIIETESSFVVTSNALDFYEANRLATLEMINLLKKSLNIKTVEAYYLVSICGDLKISQASDCPIGLTLRLAFPKNKMLLDRKKIFSKNG